MAPEAVAQLGIPGSFELLVVVLIAVLLFGANRIPKLARASGQAIGEFKKGRDEVEQELSGDGKEDVVSSGDGGGGSDATGEDGEESKTETA